jgi:hypothetical protein
VAAISGAAYSRVEAVPEKWILGLARAVAACGRSLPAFPLPLMRRLAALLCFIVSVLPGSRVLAHGGSHDALPPDAIVPGGFVSNFRLTDHNGVTRELYYESTAKAIVLVFTGTGSPRATPTADALRALRSRFGANDVVLWQIDSNLGADRTTIAAEQVANNNTAPVLIDQAQVVAAEYVVTHQLEAFVINPANWTLVYRGPLDNADPAGTAAPTQNYASDAAAALVAGTTVMASLVGLPTGMRPLELPSAVTPDYAADVAPIMIRSCIQCHSTGNIGAFVFSKYDDVQLRASQVRGDLLTKKMTPWHADPQFGVFANGVGLTPAEISTLFTWVRAGAPRGTGTDPLPTATPASSGDWPLGQPDLIVSIPRQNLPATGVVDYRYLTVPVPLTADRWLRAAVVKAGNAAVVHHALVFEGLDILNLGGGLGGFFAGYVPGMVQTFYPEGTGKLIHKNSFFTFQMHYTTTGSVQTDQTQIGLYFAPQTPARELLTRAAYTTDIAIPAGAKEYEREVSFTPSATKDVMLYELMPHMHYRGKRFRYEALYPNGTSEVLLNVPQYDFHWQSQYRLTQPKRLPAGTVLRARGAFDNSADNHDNPNPAASVQFGEQTNDEMFVGYVNYAELSSTMPAAPMFTGNRTARARVGDAFTLAATASNGATTYRAVSLPPGLALDAASGLISGTPQAAGRHVVTVVAENASGSAASSIDLIISAAASAPTITTQPVAQAVAAGTVATFTVAATGGAPLTYQWYFNGRAIDGAQAGTLTISPVAVTNAGEYSVRIANGAGSILSQSTVLGVTSTAKVTGAGSEVGPNIPHANGNIYDQVLLEGVAAAVTADPGQVVRISYIDLNKDIVQIEFAGAGTLSLIMDGATGPNPPENYNQSVGYMKGHAGIVITGANETTNVAVFSVGRANAVNQALFKDSVTYDGFADIAYIAITSTDGKFGGVRTANANYWATRGLTGLLAPGVQFTGPVWVGNINAMETATPQLVIGSGADVRVTGGDLLQTNGQPVRVSGITQLKFTAGSNSHGALFAAQANKGRLEQNGVDVTTQIVVNP